LPTIMRFGSLRLCE